MQKPFYLRENESITGVVRDYHMNDNKIEWTIDDGGQQPAILSTFADATEQQLSRANLQPDDLLGKNVTFRKEGRFLRIEVEDEGAPAEPGYDQPSKAAAQTNKPAPRPAAPGAAGDAQITDLHAKYERALALILEQTVPKLEIHVGGSLPTEQLLEFAHAAASTIVIGATKPQYNKSQGGGGGGYQSRGGGGGYSGRSGGGNWSRR